MSHASITAGALAHDGGARRAARSLLWAALWSGAVSALARAIAWYAEWRRVRRATTELSYLSDRMLKDIGVARTDIARIARYGRDVTDIRR